MSLQKVKVLIFKQWVIPFMCNKVIIIMKLILYIYTYVNLTIINSSNNVDVYFQKSH